MSTDAEKLAAAEALAAHCTDAWVMDASSFTCDEAEIVVKFLEAFGCESESFKANHAAGDDDEDDLHEPVLDEHGWAVDWKLREGSEA